MIAAMPIGAEEGRVFDLPLYCMSTDVRPFTVRLLIMSTATAISARPAARFFETTKLVRPLISCAGGSSEEWNLRGRVSAAANESPNTSPSRPGCKLIWQPSRRKRIGQGLLNVAA